MLDTTSCYYVGSYLSYLYFRLSKDCQPNGSRACITAPTELAHGPPSFITHAQMASGSAGAPSVLRVLWRGVMSWRNSCLTSRLAARRYWRRNCPRRWPLCVSRPPVFPLWTAGPLLGSAYQLLPGRDDLALHFVFREMKFPQWYVWPHLISFLLAADGTWGALCFLTSSFSSFRAAAHQLDTSAGTSARPCGDPTLFSNPYGVSKRGGREFWFEAKDRVLCSDLLSPVSCYCRSYLSVPYALRSDVIMQGMYLAS